MNQVREQGPSEVCPVREPEVIFKVDSDERMNESSNSTESTARRSRITTPFRLQRIINKLKKDKKLQKQTIDKQLHDIKILEDKLKRAKANKQDLQDRCKQSEKDSRLFQQTVVKMQRNHIVIEEENSKLKEKVEKRKDINRELNEELTGYKKERNALKSKKNKDKMRNKKSYQKLKTSYDILRNETEAVSSENLKLKKDDCNREALYSKLQVSHSTLKKKSKTIMAENVKLKVQTEKFELLHQKCKSSQEVLQKEMELSKSLHEQMEENNHTDNSTVSSRRVQQSDLETNASKSDSEEKLEIEEQRQTENIQEIEEQRQTENIQKIEEQQEIPVQQAVKIKMKTEGQEEIVEQGVEIQTAAEDQEEIQEKKHFDQPQKLAETRRELKDKLKVEEEIPRKQIIPSRYLGITMWNCKDKNGKPTINCLVCEEGKRKNYQRFSCCLKHLKVHFSNAIKCPTPGCGKKFSAPSHLKMHSTFCRKQKGCTKRV